MFGRKKDENLEEYNEKYSSKYDDDYIAPSEEYRSVCDHDHEQTYNDADTEQHPYDDRENIENFFEDILYPGEQLVWVGSRGNTKMYSNKRKTANNPVASFCFSLGTITFFIGFCFMPIVILAILLICIGMIISSKSNKGKLYYGLTNERLILSDRWERTSISLKDVTDVEYRVGRNNMGDVYLTTKNLYSKSQKANGKGYVLALQGIPEPERVESIIRDAMHGYFL